MISFELRTARNTYAGATISPGLYPKAAEADPQQIGWAVHSADGEPLGTPTVNLWSPPAFPAEGCVFIRITAEYAGWLESLEAARLVERTGRVEGAGFVESYAAEARVLRPELLEVR